MKKDFEKRKAALWTKWEKAKGFSVPEAVRERWEEAVGLMDSDCEIALRDLNGYIEDRLNELEFLEAENYFSNRKKTEVAVTKRYQRCFGKRLYLVEFVMKRHLTIANQGHKSVVANYGQRLRKRIDWKQMCVEWNEAHPNDHMSPEVLKVRYYRAIAEEDIKREYLNRRFPTILKEIWERLGVPPYSVKLVFGAPERKHNFRNDISFLTGVEELEAWQAESERMYFSQDSIFRSKLATVEQTDEAKNEKEAQHERLNSQEV
jgi:hypothetical protein